MKYAAEINNLCVRYGKTVAVDDISFKIKKGDTIGIIGENGAGKTTTVECIAGINKKYSGKITVLEQDISKVNRKFYNKLSIQLQSASFPDKLKVKEILDLYSSFYDSPLPYLDIIKKFKLEDKLNSYFSNLSGGQKQKVSIIVALISNAEILILDELTTGLDPQSRETSINVIKEYSKHKTLILTTHFLNEIEKLCDKVCIMKAGKIIEYGTLNELYDKYEMKHKFIIKINDEKRKRQLISSLDEYFNLISGNQVSIFSNQHDTLDVINQKLIKLKISPLEVEEKSSDIDDLYFKIFNQKFEEI